MADPTFTLGDRLRKARERADLTQLAIADSLGVSRPTVISWEKNTTEPTARQLERWAAAAGVSLAWLDPGHGLRNRCSDRAAGRIGLDTVVDAAIVATASAGVILTLTRL